MSSSTAAKAEAEDKKSSPDMSAKGNDNKEKGDQDNGTSNDGTLTNKAPQDSNATHEEKNLFKDSTPSSLRAYAPAEPNDASSQMEGSVVEKQIKSQQKSGPYDALPCPVSLFIAATALKTFTDDKLAVLQPRKPDFYKNPSRGLTHAKRPKLVLRNLCSKRKLVLHQNTKRELSHSLSKFYLIHHVAFFEDFEGFYDVTALKQAIDMANSEARKAEELAKKTREREDPDRVCHDKKFKVTAADDDFSDIVLALFLYAQRLHSEPKTEKFSFYNIWYPLDKLSAVAAKRSRDLDYHYPSLLPFIPNLDEDQVSILHPSNDPMRRRRAAVHKRLTEKSKEYPLVIKYPPDVQAIAGSSTHSDTSDRILDDDNMENEKSHSVAKRSSKQQKKSKKRKLSKKTIEDYDYDSSDSDYFIDNRVDEAETAPTRVVDRLKEKQEEYEERSKALAKATEFSKNLLTQAKELEELGMPSEVVDNMRQQAAHAMKEVLSVTTFPASAII